MALSLDDLTAKVDNGGVTPDGLLTAEEYNTLLAAVKENAENSTDEHIGSVVVDNTLSELDETSNKPVNSQGIAEAISAASNSLKERGYIYMGVATPTTKPNTTVGKVFYLAAQAGEYNNFGITLPTDALTSLEWNGERWFAIRIADLVTAEEVAQIILDNTASEVTEDGSMPVSGEAVNNAISPIINGGNFTKFLYTQYSAGGTTLLTTPIELAKAGDFLEIKVKVTSDTGSILSDPASYNAATIKYHSNNTLQFRLIKLSSSSWTIQNSSVVRGDIQTIRLECTSASEGSYKYEIYLNGVKQATNPTTIELTTPTIYTKLGNNDIAMDVYYLNYRTNGVDINLTNFASLPNTTGAVDIGDEMEYKGLLELTQEIKQTKMDKLMYYEFIKSSTIWDCASVFRVYKQIKDNVYLQYIIGLYDMHSSAPSGYKSLQWRLIAVNEVEINEGIITPTGKVLITYGENEFVLRQTSPSKIDFTGGYHGDEMLGKDGTFIEFYVNGNIMPIPDVDVPITPCSSFWYKQKTILIETENTDESTDYVGRDIAYHTKHTYINEDGYTTRNRIDFIESIPFYAYFGIVCINRDISAYAMGETSPLTDMGIGTPTITNQFKTLGSHDVMYIGGGYQTTVSSKINFGDNDADNEVVVYNSSTYNKYYRKTTSIETCEKIEGECKVVFKDVELV